MHLNDHMTDLFIYIRCSKEPYPKIDGILTNDDYSHIRLVEKSDVYDDVVRKGNK